MKVNLHAFILFVVIYSRESQPPAFWQMSPHSKAQNCYLSRLGATGTKGRVRSERPPRKKVCHQKGEGKLIVEMNLYSSRSVRIADNSPGVSCLWQHTFSFLVVESFLQLWLTVCHELGEIERVGDGWSPVAVCLWDKWQWTPANRFIGQIPNTSPYS